MNGDQLREAMENGDAKIHCLVCDAILWVDTNNRNEDGEPMLMRMGTIHIHECWQCDEIHRVACS